MVIVHDLQSLSAWLRQWFRNEDWQPRFVGIFGSALSEAGMPNDYDLLIVVPDSLENEYWSLLLQRRAKLIADSKPAFTLPLSPTILTTGEFHEENGFTRAVKAQPVIEVLGSYHSL